MVLSKDTIFADRFQIGDLAGTGGMGEVYRATDTHAGRIVALKILRDDGALFRFQREAAILSELRHPYIVRSFDSGETPGGDAWLSMEWLDGETLEKRLAREELTVPETIALLRAVSEALAVAHRRGIIHRDLKPSNVFLVDKRTDCPKVLDFGLARMLDASTRYTMPGHILGTFAYMAPEQANGNLDLDARADVFALGLLFYRCLARRPAFMADQLAALLAQIMSHDPTPLARLRPDLPPAMDELVMSMLAKRREDRPANASAVALAMARWGDLVPTPTVSSPSGLTNVEKSMTNIVTRTNAPVFPFVGRDREISILDSLYEECCQDSTAQAVVVTARPGVGKSRLAAEWLSRRASDSTNTALPKPRQVLHLHGDPMRAGSPLAMLSVGIRRFAEILDGEPLEVRRQKLQDAVFRRVMESDRQRVAEFLGELVRTPFPDEHRPTLQQARNHAPLLAKEMGNAFEDFVGACAAAGPFVVIAEDFHWADASSMRYLDGALRRCAKAPLFVIALGRPETREMFPRLWDERNLTEIRLQELRPRSAETLVRAALPNETNSSVAKIVEQSGGNAFYVEELCRAVLEGRKETLSENVLALVHARLVALPPQARAVLRAGSIFGEVFWQAGVEALLDLGAWAQWLDLLVEQDIVRKRSRSRFAGQTEYVFRHAFLREGAYALLTEEDRRTGHRLAATWLETMGETDALILVGHHELGGAVGRAMQWCLAAAEQAFERDDLDTAESTVARGLTLAQASRNERSIEALKRIAEMIEARRKELGAGPPPMPIEIPESAYHFHIVPGTRIFVEVCIGRWSAQFTRQYVADFKKTLAPLLGRPWGKLCNLDAWLPTEPDAAEHIIGFLQWSIQSQMTYVAYVISNPGARLQARRIIESANVNLICGFFATEDEGLQWLTLKGLGQTV